MTTLTTKRILRFMDKGRWKFTDNPPKEKDIERVWNRVLKKAPNYMVNCSIALFNEEAQENIVEDGNPTVEIYYRMGTCGPTPTPKIMKREAVSIWHLPTALHRDLLAQMPHGFQLEHWPDLFGRGHLRYEFQGRDWLTGKWSKKDHYVSAHVDIEPPGKESYENNRLFALNVIFLAICEEQGLLVNRYWKDCYKCDVK